MRPTFIAVVVLLFLPAVYADPSFTFTIVDHPGADHDPPYIPGTGTWLTGINDSGQAVGAYNTSSTIVSFLYSNGGFTDLPSDFGLDAEGISDNGTIVGGNAILSPGNSLTQLQDGGDQTFGNSISSNAAYVAGFYIDTSGSAPIADGFVYSGGVYTTLDYPGATDTDISGINDLGQMVGFYETPSAAGAFYYDGSNFTTLNAPGCTSDNTRAAGINDLGQIVGYCESTGQSFLLSDGTYSFFQVPGTDTFTEALAINNTGTIVGTYFDLSGGSTVSNPAPQYGFIATEVVPEPATFGMLLGAIVCLAGLGLRRGR
jgi:uncharacterized membrane protein